MGLRRQLLLTTIGLVVITTLLSTFALLWNGAHSALEDEAHRIASAVFRVSAPDSPGLQRLTDGLVASGDVRSIRALDTDVTTRAFSADPAADADADLSEADARSLRRAVEQGKTESYWDG